jgi:uncharacterized protein YcbX
MRLVELWRYPVKSLAGERVIAAAVDARGIEGDRLWALVDPKGGIGSARRHASGQYAGSCTTTASSITASP